MYSSFKDNVWGVDLADMQLLSKFNKGFRFLLCVIDIFSKYAWVIPLKDKKDISIVNAFHIILKGSNRKPNKIWVDKGSEFYNSSFKEWLKDKDIEMHSTNNERKSVIAERLIGTLKNKIYKYMTSISKNVYIDKLDDIVEKYSNTYHTSIKMKLVDVKDNTYIGFKKEVNDKNVLNDLNGEEIIGTFYENELQKINENEFRIEKVLKKKDDKLYVKWKGYDNSFNSWIDKKDII